jgi:hypothetical protein
MSLKNVTQPIHVLQFHKFIHYQVDNFKLRSIRQNIDFDTLQKGYEQHVLAKTTNRSTHSCIHLDGNILYS